MDSYSTQYLKINQLRSNCTNISYLFITVWEINRCLFNNLINILIHGFIDFLFQLIDYFRKVNNYYVVIVFLDLIQIIDDLSKSYEAMFFFYFVLKLPSYRLIPQNKNTSSRLTLHSQFLDSRLTLCNATSSSYLHRCKYVHICMQLRWCPVESFNVLTHFLRLCFLTRT